MAGAIHMDGQPQTSVTDDTRHEDGRSRQRSTIAFPYMGLSEAIEVAQAIHDKVGSSTGDEVQLASWLDVSSNSSGFRVRIATARLFGLIESPSTATYRLAPLGRDIVDSEKHAAAKVQAFLNVPLFDAFYERWKGRQLPPAAAIERELVALGVAEKQKDRARQTLERSANKAGFFDAGRDRLVKPGFNVTADSAPQVDVPRDERGGGNGGGGGNDDDDLHPFVKGLLRELPKAGEPWKHSERTKWLKLAASAFDLIYVGDGDIQIIEVKNQKGDVLQ
jgi:hypothetical protein